MKEYTDTKGISHFTTGVFCADAQGTIYRTTNETILLRDPEGRQRYSRAFDDIMLLPVSNVNNMILPLDTLEPCGGYTLCVPEGFVPLDTIIDSDDADKKAFYTKTGGLRRRIGILLNLAKILMQLHALPVMYGSISPGRIAVSQDASADDVYLLYSLEMSYTMDFTPPADLDGYAAPEMKSGCGGSILSDVYAFAALAFDLLTLSESFMILSQRMAECFDRTFHARGGLAERPRLSDFYGMFVEAQDAITVCKQCGMDMFYDEPVCKQCSAPISKYFKAAIYDRISETDVQRGVKILEFTTERQFFYNYHTGNIRLSENRLPTLEFVINISPDKKWHVLLKNLMDRTILVNDTALDPGCAHAVSMPFQMISISTALSNKTTRHIDIVIH